MKKFSLKLFLLFSILALFILFMEITILLFKEDIFSEKKMGNYFINIGNDYRWVNNLKSGRKILLAGGSSVRYGLSCSKLNELSKDSLSFINVARDGGNPIDLYFILKQLDLKGIKAVYFGLDPMVYSKYYYRVSNKYLYLDLNLLQAFLLSVEFKKSYIYKRYSAFFHYLFPPKRINNNNHQEIPPDYGSVKLTRVPKHFKDNIFKHFQLGKYGWSQLQFIYLKKVEDFCKKRNIDFIAFVPPKRSDYSGTYKSECKQIHQEFLDHLINLNFRPPVFGKLDQMDSLGDYDLFVESFHLNPLGQEVYTKIFYQMTLNKKQTFSPEYAWFNNN